ncbi:MAG TPA: sodium:solute symporter family protein [Terriglobia bacterium]|nr:sodium:solute symporter family protein [Terriglobia bacterium]
MNLQFAALIIYSALFIGVGLLISRRVQKADDFLVAGRRLGPGLIATTFLAANIGAGSTVGATGLGYAFGLSAWWWVGCAGIGSFILANTVGPKIWTLAARNGWRTVGDFLDHRYNRAVRGLIAVLLWMGALMILAGQLIAISQILEVVVGLPKWQGCLIGGVVVTTYFAAGGLLSSAWVNLIQLTVKFTGFLLAIPFGMAAAGGWDGLQPTIQALPALGARGILSYVAILVPSFIISPGLIQKLYGARDERAVRIGISWNAAGLVFFAFAPPILGIIAHSQYPNLENRELALPMVMTKLMPPWLGLLTLAAVFSAEISASDAILFMLSSSLSVDLYKTFLRPAASDRDLLFAGRMAAITGACLGILLAIGLPSIIAALQIFYTLMAVALSAPLIVGLYSRRPTAARAIVAIVFSVGITAFTQSSVIGIVCGFVIMLMP